MVHKMTPARRSHQWLKGFLVLVLGLIMNGCATHVISQKLRQEAAPNLPFPVALKAPQRYTGHTVIWGGIIISTLNIPKYTMIKVLQTPLGYGEEPQSDTTSQGRFIAKVPGYLDDEVYRAGRKITVAGKIVGEKVEPLGQIHYTYPIVLVEEINLWKPPRPYYWRYYGPDYWWGFPGPFYWGWYGP